MSFYKIGKGAARLHILSASQLYEFPVPPAMHEWTQKGGRAVTNDPGGVHDCIPYTPLLQQIRNLATSRLISTVNSIPTILQYTIVQYLRNTCTMILGTLTTLRWSTQYKRYTWQRFLHKTACVCYCRLLWRHPKYYCSLSLPEAVCEASTQS